jgi:hypothetical protein
LRVGGDGGEVESVGAERGGERGVAQQRKPDVAFTNEDGERCLDAAVRGESEMAFDAGFHLGEDDLLLVHVFGEVKLRVRVVSETTAKLVVGRRVE